MKFIQLTNSKYSAIIDDEDFDRVSKLNTNWCIAFKDNKPHNVISTKRIQGRYILLHRFIHNIHKENRFQIDHKFDDVFDNRKEFTRICNQSQNKANSKAYKNNKTGFKCVYKKGNKYQVNIRKNGISRCFGTYLTIEEAIEVSNKKSKEVHGEFAKIN